jgi:hypothetical protein
MGQLAGFALESRHADWRGSVHRGIPIVRFGFRRPGVRRAAGTTLLTPVAAAYDPKFLKAPFGKTSDIIDFAA